MTNQEPTLRKDVKPSYVELIELYFRAKCSVIGEFSGDISGDIVELYDTCKAWCPEWEIDDPMYLELIKEYQAIVEERKGEA